ncbi:hypothetical protein D3C79_783810 [compost metagenome]
MADMVPDQAMEIVWGNAVSPTSSAPNQHSAVHEALIVRLGATHQERDLSASPRHDSVSLLDLDIGRILPLHFQVDTNVRQPEVRQVIPVIDSDQVRLVQVENLSSLKHASP